MKRLSSLFSLAVFVSAVWGCGFTAREITRMSLSERTDVFKEVAEGGPASEGLVDLLIKASVKTHVEGYYSFETSNTHHGQSDYPFLVNIDGQAVVWGVAGEEETTPMSADQEERDVEGGEGLRYTLRKTLRLAPGPHRFILGLPGEDFLMEVDLTLKENEVMTIEFKPIYRTNRGDQCRSFVNGVTGGRIYLNGEPMSSRR